MHVIVNGRPIDLPDGATVAALVARVGADAARVAVERNQDVVPRREWAECRLADGDHVEVVTFVGGG